MKLSVIITTYNSPRWLEKVIWGYSAQEYRNFELIIADDGSGDDTKQHIDVMCEKTGLIIKHVWQQDNGFRKCRILNKGILAAESDYLVFSDGDCIPRKDFLAVHADNAEPGYYLSGSYQKLPMSTSMAITKEDIVSGRCFDLEWLKANGLKRNRKNIKLAVGPKMAQVLNHITPTNCTFKGSNGSAWRKDILSVNGFDERMPWGGLDRELGVRLINLGVQPKHLRYNAVVIHLDHKRGYKDPAQVKANKKLRQANERNKVVQALYGISQLPEYQKHS